MLNAIGSREHNQSDGVVYRLRSAEKKRSLLADKSNTADRVTPLGASHTSFRITARTSSNSKIDNDLIRKLTSFLVKQKRKEKDYETRNQ